ncbi:LytR C-terminal domain-containing protein [Noviherbaspirillum sp. ST9]|uniref:LytR C-terminal domain-containing protein n=1 Tax=Noviherbaspirillum sp. ST9 TaxID=3401606 RepID=UPI003B588DFC
MNKTRTTLATTCLAAALSGCVAAPPAQETLKVSPLLQVSHSDNSAAGLYQLGRYYQAQNRLAQAEETYRKALAAKADFVDAHSALGALYAEQGKYDEAIQEFSAVLQLAPQIAQIYNNLGYTYYLQGKYLAAVDALQRASTLEPGNPRPVNNLGAAYEKLGRADEARLAFARAQGLQQGNNQRTAGEVRVPPANDAVPGDAARPRRTASTDVQEFVGPPAPPASFASVETPAPATAYRLEVANGNGTPGLARRFRDALVSAGTPAPRLTNLKPYRQKQTVIEYLPGYREAALQLRSRFTMPVPLNEQPDARTHVRVVLGHDVTSTAALHVPKLARSAD